MCQYSRSYADERAFHSRLPMDSSAASASLPDPSSVPFLRFRPAPTRAPPAEWPFGFFPPRSRPIGSIFVNLVRVKRVCGSDARCARPPADSSCQSSI